MIIISRNHTLRRPKHSKIKVVVPKEEEEETKLVIDEIYDRIDLEGYDIEQNILWFHDQMYSWFVNTTSIQNYNYIHMK